MSFDSDKKPQPPTAQTGNEAGKFTRPEDLDWLKLAKDAYTSSTSYVDTNYRKAWEDGIRAFNNQHSTDSKYNQPAYDKRSKVFRPQTRTVIRKNEAAAAAAFFSNMDVVDVEPNDQANKAEMASAEIMKQILQYRLTKTIPWYQIVLGGLQDAQTTGAVCAHVYWDYSQKEQMNVIKATVAPVAPAEEGGTEEYPVQNKLPEGAFAVDENDRLIENAGAQPEVTIMAQAAPIITSDKPVIDLFPVENLRIDPGANWMDPVNSSPYVIQLIPMYVIDVKEKMVKGEWRQLDDDTITAAKELSPDTTRLARQKGRTDPYAVESKPATDYEIVWVQRHIHRKNGEDWEFYTMADVAMLTDPRPLSEVVFTGKRPYVLGYCILESHKIFPSSIPTLSKGLQEESNEIANQRADNVKFVLNKKWFVKRGKEADVAGLIRNVPGGVVMLDDPEGDVREVTWPDVTGSAFEEQRGIDMAMDSLLGNFNPAAIMTQGTVNSPARNMSMLSQSQGTLVEYLLRTYVETFVQPILRQLVQLEQQYETDRVVLAIASKKAELFQRFGIDEVTDELLEQELTLTVNVGMGATDPMQKLNKFMTAMTAFVAMMQKPPPGINMEEVGKEIFGHLGYSDGKRFFTSDDPAKAQLQEQVRQLMELVMKQEQQLKEKMTGHQVNLQKTQETNRTKVITTQIHEANQNKRELAEHMRALMAAGAVDKQQATRGAR